MPSYSLLLVVAFAMSALVVLGDIFLKFAGQGPSLIWSRWFALGALSYALSACGWVYVIKYVKFATVGVIFSVSIVLVMALIGTLYFNEKLKPVEGLGIAMAILSLILLSRFSE